MALTGEIEAIERDMHSMHPKANFDHPQQEPSVDWCQSVEGKT